MKKFNLKYIVTEISLVTIGILVALAIDNWNSDRLMTNEVNDYLVEIQFEIENSGISYQKDKLKNIKFMTDKLVRVMKIVERNDTDSIPYLRELIWPIGTTWPVNYNLPIIDEFIDKDLLNKINDDSLKSYLKLYSSIKRNSTGMAEFNEKQYLDKVETFVNKNIEYLEITRGSFWKKNDIENHPRIRTNFKKLFNDLEFWNILTLKTETFSIELSNLKYHNRTFKSINNQLKLYLKKNKISPKLNNEN
jgi:hypothetical protein